MTNHRIRSALSAAGMTGSTLASEVGVDPKSVERWITQDRMPRPATRMRVATLLELDETYLWPALLADGRAVTAAQSELVQLWPSREAVPGDVWATLIHRARERVEVLVYSGGFLVETFGLDQLLTRVSSCGGRARILLGDSNSGAVQQRGHDEGLPTLPARAASTLDYLANVRGLPGVEVRVHSTPLYVSIYRFDDEMLVNCHTHGAPAKDSPVFHYQRVPGATMFRYYTAAFSRAWDVGYAPPA